MNALKTLKPDLAIKSVRKTASGAMLIHPKEPKDCNSLLKVNAFALNSVLGLDVKARLPKSQTITHQVIIKDIDADITEDEVKEILDRQKLPYSNVKRIWSRQRNGPSNMMRLILKDEAKKKHLLKNNLYLDEMIFKCVPAKEDVEKKLNAGIANSGMTTKPSNVKMKRNASSAPVHTGSQIAQNKRRKLSAPTATVHIPLGLRIAQSTKPK